MRMDARRLPRRLIFCLEKDIRAFGISVDWEALLLQEDVLYNTEVEGGQRFMDAWRRIEEQASEMRQEKRMEKETGNASVVRKVAVRLTD